MLKVKLSVYKKKPSLKFVKNILYAQILFPNHRNSSIILIKWNKYKKKLKNLNRQFIYNKYKNYNLNKLKKILKKIKCK